MKNNSSVPHVLLADEDAGIQQMLGSFFSQVGWNYDIVANGDSAIEAISSRSYDIIVTDLVMPGLSGLELLKNFREQNPSQAIIVVTGESKEFTSVDVFKVGGAIDLLTKPLDLSLLDDAVKRVWRALRQKRLETNLYRYVVSERVEFSFTSAEIANLKFPVHLIEHLFESGMIDMSTRLQMELAFQEAIANSLDHGNLELKSEWREEINDQGGDRYTEIRSERLLDPKYANRILRISIEFNDEEITISIKDNGPGFSVCGPDKKVCELGDVQVHGRGMTIISGTMDSVRYEDTGRVIIMKKSIKDIN